MQLTYTAAASAIVLSGLAAAADSLVVNTPPALFTCENALLSWTGGTAPYTVRINQAGSESVTLETISQSNTGTSYTWEVNVAAGSPITVAVTDSTGFTNYSGESPTIATGTSTSCVGSSSTASGSSSTASDSTTSTSSASAATSSTATSSGTARTTSGASTSASSSAASASPSSTQDSASTVRGFSAVVAGAVGVVVAALL